MKIINKLNKKQFLALTVLTVLGCAFVQPCKSMDQKTQRRLAVLKNQINPKQKTVINNPTAEIIAYDREPSSDSSGHVSDSLRELMSMIANRITAENIDEIEKTQNVLSILSPLEFADKYILESIQESALGSAPLSIKHLVLIAPDVTQSVTACITAHNIHTISPETLHGLFLFNRENASKIAQLITQENIDSIDDSILDLIVQADQKNSIILANKLGKKATPKLIKLSQAASNSGEPAVDLESLLEWFTPRTFVRW